jgi:8-oxo-dGTP diphosphatase
MIQDENGRYLLLKRSASSKANAGKWDLPGGKIEPSESFDKALLREVSEETGLAITLKHVAGTAESELPAVKVIYLILEGRLDTGNVILSSEHEEFAWVERNELPGMDLPEQFIPFIRQYSQKAVP